MVLQQVPIVYHPETAFGYPNGIDDDPNPESPKSDLHDPPIGMPHHKTMKAKNA